jgi:protein gp37
MKNRMYSDVVTWNPYKGCLFDCFYCRPSFQAQAKRQKHNCNDCYNYVPHEHPERLNKIPSAGTVFTCGNGDISFCRPEFARQIIEAIKQRPKKTFYLQSKRPAYFQQFLKELPSNVIILTTLETNRDEGYREVSKAPAPSIRYHQIKNLSYPRKVATIEPVLDFDLEIFASWIIDLNPEYVWLGFNSRPKQVRLPEPSEKKLGQFISELKLAGIEIKGKELRSIRL